MAFLLDLSKKELGEELSRIGQKPYTADQIFDWVYKKGVYDYQGMSNLSKSLRETLPNELPIVLPTVFKRQDDRDGTIKLLLEMADGAKVETVLMRYDYGNAVCVSSQVGCNMGCAFCASGLLKKERNLSCAEMMGQVLCINQILRETRERVTHVVVMGTGEPFDNYEEVMKFIRLLNDPKALEIGARHITVSTCGLVNKIIDYGREGIQINLAISLHASNQKTRETLMPIARAYPMDKLMEAVKTYVKDSGRRVTFEYILLAGVNDSVADAIELAKLVRGTLCYVNLIPYNEVKEKPYKRSSRQAVKAFHDTLMKNGVNATVRKEFGTGIDAACGQLRAKEQGRL